MAFKNRLFGKNTVILITTGSIHLLPFELFFVLLLLLLLLPVLLPLFEEALLYSVFKNLECFYMKALATQKIVNIKQHMPKNTFYPIKLKHTLILFSLKWILHRKTPSEIEEKKANCLHLLMYFYSSSNHVLCRFTIRMQNLSNRQIIIWRLCMLTTIWRL